MTSQNAQRDDFDRLMSQWMEADGRVREPEQLLESVLERTRVARRIPGWLLPERWIPVQLTMPTAGRATARPSPLAHRPGARRHRGNRGGRLPAAPAGSIRTGSQRPRRLRIERPDLRRRCRRLELRRVDVRHANGVHARVVARRDQGRVQADRRAISGEGPDTVRRSRRGQRRRLESRHDRTGRQGG